MNNSIAPRKRVVNKVRCAIRLIPAHFWAVSSLFSCLHLLIHIWKRDTRWPGPSNRRGFTLLEVLVALAILAISMTTLFGAQSQSLIFATEAKFNTTASLLAGLKLAELESGRLEPVDAEGTFDKDFPEYTWKITAQDPSTDLSEWLKTAGEGLLQIDLIISRRGNSYLYKTRCYIRKRHAL